MKYIKDEKRANLKPETVESQENFRKFSENPKKLSIKLD
jgi:hypothetical protein